MSFPRDARYIQDWSPASGLPYHAFLQNKRYEQTLLCAIPGDLLDLIATEERLAGLGYTVAEQQNQPGFTVLIRNVSGIEDALRLGAGDTSSALRWSMTSLAIGMPRLQEKNDQPNLPAGAAAPAASWAYEQFVQAQSEYVQGHYRAALELVTQAISGHEMHHGHAGDFRLPYLLGRIRIGSWFGPHKNAARDILDSEKAETAFNDALRLLRQQPEANSAEAAHCTLWAARAAYIHGDLTRAIGNTAQALQMLSPANGSLYHAAQYQYAKFLCTRAGGNDISHASELLRSLIRNESHLLLEAATDPQFLAHSDMLVLVIADAEKDAREVYEKHKSEISDLLRQLASYSYAEIPAAQMLRSEIKEITNARDSAHKLAESGGLINLVAASTTLSEVVPKPGHLFGLYRSRFNKECKRQWEALPATQAAKNAVSHHTRCKETFEHAEAYYREHGGFNRSGGQEKLGYAVISSLLTVYMVAAQSRWGGPAILFAFACLIVAGWFYWSYFRIRFGWVEGHEAWQQAKTALENAGVNQDRRGSAAARAWKHFERNIEGLGNLKAPF